MSYLDVKLDWAIDMLNLAEDTASGGKAMTYRIHFDLPDGSSDSVLVTGETVEEIREKSQAELAKRGGINPWSEPA